MTEHWFWFLLLLAALTWYITITTYVAIKGATDIKNMLKNIGSPTTPGSAGPPPNPQ